MVIVNETLWSQRINFALTLTIKLRENSEYVVYLLTIIYLRMVKFYEVIYLTYLIYAWNLYYWKSCAMLISVPC